jgi:hypothetical protein
MGRIIFRGSAFLAVNAPFRRTPRLERQARACFGYRDGWGPHRVEADGVETPSFVGPLAARCGPLAGSRPKGFAP